MTTPHPDSPATPAPAADRPGPATPAARPSARARRIGGVRPASTFSGAAGALLVAGVAASVVLGALLGVLRPGQPAEILPGGAASVPEAAMGAGFPGLVLATALSGAAGAGLGALAWARHARWRGAGMLVIAGLVAAVTALGIITVGDVVGLLRQGDPAAAAPGDVVTLIPPIPRLVPALVAALLAMLAYWSGVLLGGRDGEGPVAPGPTR